MQLHMQLVKSCRHNAVKVDEWLFILYMGSTAVCPYIKDICYIQYIRPVYMSKASCHWKFVITALYQERAVQYLAK